MYSTKSTIGELATPTVAVSASATVRQMLCAFTDNPRTQGVVVPAAPGQDAQVVTRSRFFECLARPFFKDLYLTKTVREYLAYVPEDTLAFEADTLVYEAAEIAMDREGDRFYDPILVEFARGPAQLVDMRDLMRAQADVLRSASRTANETLSRFLKSQEELLQARKMEAVGTLSAGLAHELNTPLQFVGSNLAFIERLHDDHRGLFDGNPPAGLPCSFVEDWRDELPGALADIRHGLTRMADIVAAMKTFAGEEGRGPTPLDANETIRSATILTQGLWNGRVGLNLDLAPKLPPLRGTANALTQAWMNILTNAFQALEPVRDRREGLVEIRTRPLDERSIEVTIRDNGIGMDEATSSRCFNPFFTTRSPGHGTGQGLAIVHQTLVNGHGGRVLVESRLGHGTTVRVLLPAE